MIKHSGNLNPMFWRGQELQRFYCEECEEVRGWKEFVRLDALTGKHICLGCTYTFFTITSGSLPNIMLTDEERQSVYELRVVNGLIDQRYINPSELDRIFNSYKEKHPSAIMMVLW